jgi:hypothetical protein
MLVKRSAPKMIQDLPLVVCAAQEGGEYPTPDSGPSISK